MIILTISNWYLETFPLFWSDVLKAIVAIVLIRYIHICNEYIILSLCIPSAELTLGCLQ